MRIIKQIIPLIIIFSLSLLITACGGSEQKTEQRTEAESRIEEMQGSESVPSGDQDENARFASLTMMVDDTEVPVHWEDNESLQELKELAASGLTISMSMYGGFEQVGPIGQELTRDDHQTTTEPGDIVLYSGNQLVVFYGSNSWSYTRLGKIDLPESELNELLSNGDVTITLRCN